jgi:hypothetical protein
VLLLAQLAIQVLAHGALYAFPGNQEHGAPADVHPVVGYALEWNYLGLVEASVYATATPSIVASS